MIKTAFDFKCINMYACVTCFFSNNLTNYLYYKLVVGAFSGRIGLPPAVMGWAASCNDGP